MIAARTADRTARRPVRQAMPIGVNAATWQHLGRVGMIHVDLERRAGGERRSRSTREAARPWATTDPIAVFSSPATFPTLTGWSTSAVARRSAYRPGRDRHHAQRFLRELVGHVRLSTPHVADVERRGRRRLPCLSGRNKLHDPAAEQHGAAMQFGIAEVEDRQRAGCKRLPRAPWPDPSGARERHLRRYRDRAPRS